MLIQCLILLTPILKSQELDSARSGRQHGQVIAIREDATGGIKVSGIHAEICSSEAEMFRCLSDGSVQRTTGATLMNEQSSRLEGVVGCWKMVLQGHWLKMV